MVTCTFLVLSCSLLFMVVGIDLFVKNTDLLQALSVLFSKEEFVNNRVYLYTWLFAMAWSAVIDYRLYKQENKSN